MVEATEYHRDSNFEGAKFLSEYPVYIMCWYSQTYGHKVCLFDSVDLEQ